MLRMALLLDNDWFLALLLNSELNRVPDRWGIGEDSSQLEKECPLAQVEFCNWRLTVNWRCFLFNHDCTLLLYGVQNFLDLINVALKLSRWNLVEHLSFHLYILKSDILTKFW